MARARRAPQGGAGGGRERRRARGAPALAALERLLEEIRRDGPAPLYLAYGPERRLVRRLEEALREALGLEEPGLRAVGLRRLDGRQLGLGEVVRQARWLPLGAGRQLLVVEEPAWFEGTPSEAELRALEAYLDEARPPAATVLLLEPAGEPDRRRRLARLVEERGRVLAAAPLGEAELAEAARDWGRRRGRAITAEAAHLLAQAAPGGLEQLLGELERLDVALEPGEAVDAAALARAGSPAAQASVFELVDAVVEGAAGRALSLFRRLRSEGEAPARLLALVARQFRLIGQVRALRRGGEEPGRLPGLHPYALRKAEAQAPLVDEDRLLAALRALEEADLSVKTGRREETEAAELALARIALSSPRRAAGGTR